LSQDGTDPGCSGSGRSRRRIYALCLAGIEDLKNENRGERHEGDDCDRILQISPHRAARPGSECPHRIDHIGLRGLDQSELGIAVT
jgi:hypothetical protein